MPLLPSEWLSQLGIAEFETSASTALSSYAEYFAGSRGGEFFRAFTEFGAVEFALAPLYHSSLKAGAQRILNEAPEPYPVFPVLVTYADVMNAIYKTNCGPFDEHGRKQPAELRSWDVFTFAGDMSKVEMLGFGNDVNSLADPVQMRALYYSLAQRYESADLGSRVVESGLLSATCLVWFAKLTLLRGEDYTAAQDLLS